MSSSNLDRVRANALERIARNERHYKAAFFCLAFVEAAFLIAFILLADLSNRLHVLLLLSAVAIYSIVITMVVALISHMSRCTERVLRAIELEHFPRGEREA